ncbi:MAG: hypothetical protein ACRD43_15405, partial [Pyrinomonadaceae bacterium]
AALLMLSYEAYINKVPTKTDAFSQHAKKAGLCMNGPPTRLLLCRTEVKAALFLDLPLSAHRAPHAVKMRVNQRSPN